MDIQRKTAIASLQKFKVLRDALLFEDTTETPHHLNRFIEFIENDELVRSALNPLDCAGKIDFEDWINQTRQLAAQGKWSESLVFPTDNHSEICLRYELIERIAKDGIFSFGQLLGIYDNTTDRFLSLVVRPFVSWLGDSLSEAVGLVSSEERSAQAVPLSKIPSKNEINIFLSHKTIDKPRVDKYYRALLELGFNPWLDEPELTAGKNLERGLLDGFERSCASVFFITDNFKDEKFLATEIDYAIRQHRKKDGRFVIITLIFSESQNVPSLLERFVYKPVTNDLDGLYEIIRALPIHLGPPRWKDGIGE